VLFRADEFANPTYAAAPEPQQPQQFIQTGGHEGAFVKLDGGKIMKRVSKNEFEFYNTTLQTVPDIKPLLPQFYGVEQKAEKSMTFLLPMRVVN
jgi:hypothetical protein